MIRRPVLNHQTAPQRDIVTGLYNYKEFIGRYSRKRQNMDKFSVAVLRLAANPAEAGAVIFRNLQMLRCRKLLHGRRVFF